MTARRNTIKLEITTHTGERVDLEVTPDHLPRDIIAALIGDGKLPAQDAEGNVLQYELVHDAANVMLAADKPLGEQGVEDGAKLRVKVGSRVAAEAT
jgi:hypothetical protein